MCFFRQLLSQIILYFLIIVHGKYNKIRPINAFKDGSKIHVLRIIPRNNDDINFIEKLENVGVDVWLHGGVGKPVDIAVTNSTFASLTFAIGRNGMTYKIMVNDLQRKVKEERIENQVAKHSFRRKRSLENGKEPLNEIHHYFLTLPEIEYWLDKTGKIYSNLAKIETIGKTYEGNSIKVVKISNKSSKKKIWIDAGIHAREWIAPSTAMYIIHQLLKYENRHIIDDFEWHILPVANPDGYRYTFTEQYYDARFWRKNRRPVYGNGIYTVFGVDLNRNFDNRWLSVGASSIPWSDNYAGEKPFSEPETKAMRDYLTKEKDNMILYLTLHSYGQMLLAPFGSTYDIPENMRKIRQVSHATLKAIRKIRPRRTRYIAGQAAYKMYRSSGVSYDWAKEQLTIPYSYILELAPSRRRYHYGKYGFLVSPKEIIPVGKEIWEGLKAMVEEIKRQID